MKHFLWLCVLLAAGLSAWGAAAEVEVTKLRTFCSSGKERTDLNGYKEAELLLHEGKGCLTHMWFGGDWPGYDKTVIRVHVDGEERPSIEMELGLGHGVGFGDKAAPWGSEKMGKTGYPSGLYNTYKIPFGKSIRITAQRAKDSPDGAPFWWILRGTENLPVTLAGLRLPDSARLKLHKLENHVAKPLEEFALCDVKGVGALYQVTIAAEGSRKGDDWTSLSFLEAIMRAYIDDDKTAMQLSSYRNSNVIHRWRGEHRSSSPESTVNNIAAARGRYPSDSKRAKILLGSVTHFSPLPTRISPELRPNPAIGPDECSRCRVASTLAISFTHDQIQNTK